MSYQPVVATLEDVQPIPGADRIVSATAGGHRVVVSADRRAGERGVVVPAGAELDVDFALAAGLLARHPVTGERLGGYLGDPPVVTCITLKGARTEALWLPLGVFVEAARTGASRCVETGSRIGAVLDFPDLVDGLEIAEIPLSEADRLCGTGSAYVVARKHVPTAPARRPTSAAIGSKQPASTPAESTRLRLLLPEHYQTPPVHRALRRVPVGATVLCTEKIHGQSGAVLRARVPPASGWRGLVRRIAALLGREATGEVVAGTRRVRFVLPPGGGDRPDFRRDVAAWVASRLLPGEAVYYEVAGYDHNGRPLQLQRPRDQGAESAALRATWGAEVRYSYGCDPRGVPVRPGAPYPAAVGLVPQQRVFAYRVTRDGVDLPAHEARRRALEIGVEVPPVLGMWAHAPDRTALAVTAGGPDDLKTVAVRATVDAARALAEGPGGLVSSTLDDRHPREGVVLRVDLAGEAAGSHVACKLHAYGFKLLAGLARDPDPEDDA